MPGQERRWRHGEDLGPAPAGEEPCQCGEPHPVGRRVPHPAGAPAQPGEPQCRDVHWPPPRDQLGMLWMPLASAQLTQHGIRPSAEAAADVARQAAASADHAQAVAKKATPSAADVAGESRTSSPSPFSHGPPGGGRQAGQSLKIHHPLRYDAFPPWTDPDTWWYHCNACGGRLTGAEIKTSPVIHVVPAVGHLTSTGQPLVSYTQYGGTTPPGTQSRPAAPGA